MLKGKNIADSLNSRENNFDLIRFIAATLVIFSHSYPLTLGSNLLEPMIKITHGQETFGGLGVSLFFVISGFFITYSYFRANNIYEYLRNRILRIFPALILLLIVTVFIFGPLLSTLSIKDYFSNPLTIRYLESFMLVNMQYSLPGVFEHNPYPNAVNGSLWTIWYEFFFYIVVAGLGTFKLIRRSSIIPLFLIVWVISFRLSETSAAYQYIALFKYFSMGMLVYLFRSKIILNSYLAILSVIVLLIATYVGYYNLVFIFAGSYLIFYLGFGVKKTLPSFQNKGDFSYGMYIYAFPVQQLISFILLSHLTPWLNFLIAAPVTFALSILSWFLVEKKAMKLKKSKISVSA